MNFFWTSREFHNVPLGVGLNVIVPDMTAASGTSLRRSCRTCAPRHGRVPSARSDPPSRRKQLVQDRKCPECSWYVHAHATPCLVAQNALGPQSNLVLWEPSLPEHTRGSPMSHALPATRTCLSCRNHTFPKEFEGSPMRLHTSTWPAPVVKHCMRAQQHTSLLLSCSWRTAR